MRASMDRLLREHLQKARQPRHKGFWRDQFQVVQHRGAANQCGLAALGQDFEPLRQVGLGADRVGDAGLSSRNARTAVRAVAVAI